MKFPDKPTCHPPMGPMFVYGNDFEWREPKPDFTGPGTHLSHHVRTCSYCGSVHPEDLLKLLENGAQLEGADWKYGWPHKFYITAPNPNKGETVQIGRRSEPRFDQHGRVCGYVEEPIMGTAGDLHGKWYNDHLKDELDQEAFDALSSQLLKHTGIIFVREADGRIKYGRRRDGL